MGILLQIAAVVSVVLGLAYIAVPQTMHRFDLRYLRGNSSKLSKKEVWLYRLVGMALIVLMLSRLSF